MSSKNKIRLAASFFLIFIPIWYWITRGLWDDYLELVNKEPIVQLSLITLWLPVGFFGALLSIIALTPKAIYTGKKINECFSPKTYQLSNKVAKYFAILGIFTAIGFAWHSFNLLDEYGYQYNSKLTKITPTGIHLVYTKP